MKVRITDIHPDDAVYGRKKDFIGEVRTLLICDAIKCPWSGFRRGNFTPDNPNGKNAMFFAGVKYEEVTMKKYVTLNSAEVQEALFKAGFRWEYGESNVQNLQGDYLAINECEGVIRYGCYKALFQDLVEGVTPILSEDIIRDPFQLDGAKKPPRMIEVKGREWSEDTIAEALKKHAADY